MKKVLFWIENNWVFGKLHNELIKTLYPEVYCDILDWFPSYTSETFKYLIEKYDFIITTPRPAINLVNLYQVPYEKIIAIPHSTSDIWCILSEFGDSGRNYFDLFKGYAAINESIVIFSANLAIGRVPSILPYGTNPEIYRKHINLNKSEIKTLGYTGAKAIFLPQNNYGRDIKRGYLVERVAELTGLKLYCPANTGYLHFLSSDAMYSNIDLLIFSSLTEGHPYTAMEAFSCGIPVLGTKAGMFPEMAKSGGGITLPFEEDKFIESAVKMINFLKKEKSTFLRMKEAAYEESKKFDWKVLRESWINYINNLN